MKKLDTVEVDDISDSTSITPMKIKPDRLHADGYQHFQTGQSFGASAIMARTAKNTAVWNNLYSKTDNLKNIFSKRSQSIGNTVIH